MAWLYNIFLPKLERDDRSRILLLDSHSSYIILQFIWDYFINNVHLFYLIPYSSYILQPLNLVYFSAVKSRYRVQITDLARYEDSAPIKKLRFVEYYYKAREEGLTAHNIRQGWAAPGISPWDPRKVIRSSQLAANNQVSRPATPKACHKRKVSTSEVLPTPQNKQEFLKAVQIVSSQATLLRSVRRLLFKTGKAFNTLHHQYSQDFL